MRFDTAIIKIYIQYHCHGRWHLLKIHLNQLGHPKKHLTQGRWLLLLQIDTCQAANIILTIKIKFKWNLIMSGLPVTTGRGVFILIIILSIAISVSTETEKTFPYHVTGMLLKKENTVNTFYFLRMLAYFSQHYWAYNYKNDKIDNINNGNDVYKNAWRDKQV